MYIYVFLGWVSIHCLESEGSTRNITKTSQDFMLFLRDIFAFAHKTSLGRKWTMDFPKSKAFFGDTSFDFWTCPEGKKDHLV